MEKIVYQPITTEIAIILTEFAIFLTEMPKILTEITKVLTETPNLHSKKRNTTKFGGVRFLFLV